MSKKMLKRSLALGALMAFVITGQAWAAEVVKVDPVMPKSNITADKGANQRETIYVLRDENGLQEDATLSRDYALVEDTKNPEANTAKGYSYNPQAEYPDTYVFNLNGNKLTVPGGIRVLGNDRLDINGISGSALYLNGSLQGNGIVKGIDTIDIKNGGLYTYGANIKVYTKNLLVDNPTGSGINLQEGGSGSVTIDTDYLQVSSGNRALNAAYDSSLFIITDKINIIKSAKASRACLGGSIYLEAENGEILSDISASADYGGVGTVDLILGTGVNWTGKFITDSGSTGTLILNGTWDNNGASSLTNATFNAGSTLVIEGKTFDVKEGSAVYALNGVGDKATLTVENGAKLKINGITETTYNIAQGFANLADAKDKWEVSDINTLMQGVAWTSEEGLQVKVFAKDGGDVAEDLGVSEATGDFLSNLAKDAGDVKGNVEENTAEGKLVGLAKAAAESNNPVVVAKAAEAVQKMAEAGGNSATAANVVTNVTNVTGQRLSFSGGNAGGNKGGHGVGLLEEGSGAAIWAQYVHGKDSVEDMPSEAGASSYEGQYNGIVMGVDFKKVGKFQSGIAFNYGEGDTNSVNTTSPTRSEYDFWGVGYYGNIRNADSNVIFDIGYAKTDSDVTSNVNVGTLKQTYEASPETTTWTAGVKVEKLYQNNNVQIVPYTGLRYMSIDPEDYTTKCGAMGYKMERQDIWLLPVGVSIKQEIVNPNGWVVTPKVDLSYIWAFGDTDSSMETNTVFGSDNRPIGYDVMDDGSWMGLVGVEAAMDDWTFGVSYSYQKGDHSESKKWYVDAKYSF